ncbi:MAG: hypothetical protein A4E62_02759 [Syntrophorhabdus sp. PtaU1.Bin002]|nr:MAG: hypothetical protein A4E58_01081 [Syntrophorhabdus sp. PtaB.Bin006]OPY65064.1 MAG: hypothetical protein A4E62_02759 [Syntrophorhabdus sp. PtaU1.Bin002]
MELPEYISVKEVKRVCKELKIRDWTRLKKPTVLAEEAKLILSEVNTENMKIDLKEFTTGLEVELEHGIRFADANVTNNHPIITGMIVLAHLKESLDYYKLLDVAEAEGDLVKAVAAGDVAKIKKYYKKVQEARIVLSQAEVGQIK